MMLQTVENDRGECLLQDCTTNVFVVTKKKKKPKQVKLLY